MAYKRKKPVFKFDELKKPIIWNPYFGKGNSIFDVEIDKYNNDFIQNILRTKLAMLFEYYGIKPKNERNWPPILPKEKRKATHGLAPIDPFFNLAVAMAFDFWPGFEVVEALRKVGRPKGEGKYEKQMFYLLAIMKIKLRANINGTRRSEKKIIENEVADKKSKLYGHSASGLYRNWKRLKKQLRQSDASSLEGLKVRKKSS